MKLVEKRCPRCGGGLSFDLDAKEVMCTFCRAKYEIDRTEAGNNINDDNPNHYNLNTIDKKGSKIVIIIVFLIAAFIFIAIVASIFTAIPSTKKVINSSKKATHIITAKEYINGTRFLVNSGGLNTYDTEASYYIPYKCINTSLTSYVLEEGYVVIKYGNSGFEYYWIGRDEFGYSVPKLTEEGKLNESSIVSSKDKLNLNQKVTGTNKILMLNEQNCLSFEDKG